jgi:tRNA C32,U32 (ribose-2'-O)-methylase TrmJ
MDERLRRLFARAGLLEDEVQMLRGLCSDLEKNL